MPERKSYLSPLQKKFIGAGLALPLAATFLAAPYSSVADLTEIPGIPSGDMWSDCGLENNGLDQGRAVTIQVIRSAQAYETRNQATGAPEVAATMPAAVPDDESLFTLNRMPEQKLQFLKGPRRYGGVEIKRMGTTIAICVREDLMDPHQDANEVAFLNPNDVIAEAMLLRGIESGIDKSDVRRAAPSSSGSASSSGSSSSSENQHNQTDPYVQPIPNAETPEYNAQTHGSLPDTAALPNATIAEHLYPPQTTADLPSESEVAQLVEDPDGDGYVTWNLEQYRNQGCNVPGEVRIPRELAGAIKYLFQDPAAQDDMVMIMQTETEINNIQGRTNPNDHGFAQNNWAIHEVLLRNHGFRSADDLYDAVKGVYAATLIRDQSIHAGYPGWRPWKGPADQGCIVKAGSSSHLLLRQIANRGLAEKIGRGGKKNNYVAYRWLAPM